MDTLPFELLIDIAQYFEPEGNRKGQRKDATTFALVCRRFHDALERILWRKHQVSGRDLDASPDSATSKLQSVIKHIHFVRILELKPATTFRIRPENLLLYIKPFKDLQSFVLADISSRYPTDWVTFFTLLADVVALNPNLKSVDITRGLLDRSSLPEPSNTVNGAQLLLNSGVETQLRTFSLHLGRSNVGHCHRLWWLLTTMLAKPLERVEEMAFHETSDSFYVDDDDDENMDPERDDSDKYGRLDFARLKCLNVTRPPWDDNVGEVFEWFTDETIARIKTLKFKFGIRLGTLESLPKLLPRFKSLVDLEVSIIHYLTETYDRALHGPGPHDELWEQHAQLMVEFLPRLQTLRFSLTNRNAEVLFRVVREGEGFRLDRTVVRQGMMFKDAPDRTIPGNL